MAEASKEVKEATKVPAEKADQQDVVVDNNSKAQQETDQKDAADKGILADATKTNEQVNSAPAQSDEASKPEEMEEGDAEKEVKKQAKSEHIPTLYIRNLNDKIKLEEMRVNLYMLFSTYGEIVQVRMRQTQQLRGQAFIVFKEQMSADRALTELQSLKIFGTPIAIEYARQKSDETRRQQHETLQQKIVEGLAHPGATSGNLSLQKVAGDRRKKRQQKFVTKRDERRERLMKQESELQGQRQKQETTQTKAMKEADERIEVTQKKQKEIDTAQEETKIEVKPPVLQEKEKPKRTTRTSARAAKAQPSNLIQIENLPINFSRLMLEELTKNYPGVDSILEADGPGCRAVIKFDSSDQAKFAVMGLNRFRVDQSGRELRVNFHKAADSQ